ncbi:ABC transporter ATP-binding protein [bacterium]|nr:ABC transporter ATP-binding protein [bacterium]
MADKLLKLKGIGKDYAIKSKEVMRTKQILIAVDHVDLEITKGQTLGLVGESGCGKSTLGKLICRLEEPSRGEIIFSGRPIHDLKGKSLRQIRNRFQPVFQDPLGSLNPRLNVFQTLAEPLRLKNKPADQNAVITLLQSVGLGPELLYRYAHQLSGGQQQRLGIARALSLDPELIVADEPVSSLDVSIQAQILNLFLELQKQLSLTMIFISHDLRVISQLVDQVAVMYVGRIMELAPTQELFTNPQHPYTWALLEALPKLEPGRKRKRSILTGDIPSPINPAPGCHFYSRCKYRDAGCEKYENALWQHSENHQVACQKMGKIKK